MQRMFVPGANGYRVPLLLQVEPAAKTAVLVVHGFGSGKDRATASKMRDDFAARGAGFCALDLPAHGESPVDGHYLTVENALADLATAEDVIHRYMPKADIAFFASSFGAYLTSLYLARRPRRLTPPRAVLRCAALTMPRLLWEELGEAKQSELKAGRDVYLESYDPPILISPAFINSMLANDPFAQCRPRMADLLLIHGTADEVAPIAEARRFSRQFGYPLLEVEGADHRFQGPGQMAAMARAAVAHLCR
ncbi:MAG: alpha/beta fold hydrolase [Firmicutes bacterium]|nr:alpha/beta fold hydrolase [Bacillota bacterium]